MILDGNSGEQGWFKGLEDSGFERFLLEIRQVKLLASQEVKAIRAENLEAVEVGADLHHSQHVRRSRRAPRSRPGGLLKRFDEREAHYIYIYI